MTLKHFLKRQNRSKNKIRKITVKSRNYVKNMGVATTTYSTYTVRSANTDSEIWYVQYVLLVGWKGQFGPNQKA